MKDSLKIAIEELVASSVKIFMDGYIPMRVVLAISADREKENRFTGIYRDFTEAISHTENRFLNQQFISDGRIKIEQIPLYRKEINYRPGDYIVYVLDWLDSSFPSAF